MVGVVMVKRSLEKRIEKRSFNKCPQDRITPSILWQYRTLCNLNVPLDLSRTIVPIALTLYDLDEATDSFILVDVNNVNNKRLPTTECVAPESSNASPPSKADTTPIPATSTLWFELCSLHQWLLL
ncbi:hypothetical protein O181_075059 [Austropuccinia psidii MF-1]|uniref:Uncharacterized protein n=1 Tax=Austropuccinia psidii MF-1 TaxID=1389203 RepID=A0A9Q3IE29_9BASI|nr:hypothetical protein [Austropuccinia psidii MF-1]